MHCTRCNVAHTSEHPLVASEHGLLCDACVRVVEAMKHYEYGYPPILIDEQGPIIDPLSNPYEEAFGPTTNYMSIALDKATEDLLRQTIDARSPDTAVVVQSDKPSVVTVEQIHKAITKAVEDVSNGLVSKYLRGDKTNG